MHWLGVVKSFNRLNDKKLPMFALESGRAINKTNFVWPQFLSKRVNVFRNQPVRLLIEIFLRNFDSKATENVIGKEHVS